MFASTTSGGTATRCCVKQACMHFMHMPTVLLTTEHTPLQPHLVYAVFSLEQGRHNLVGA